MDAIARAEQANWAAGRDDRVREQAEAILLADELRSARTADRS
jgi:hypothetical protein